jgi:membrane-associated protein
MTYPRFLIYNIVGGIVWTALFVFGGFFFGNLPFVRDHFTLVIIAIILISMLPIAYEFLAHRMRRPVDASETPAS